MNRTSGGRSMPAYRVPEMPTEQPRSRAMVIALIVGTLLIDAAVVIAIVYGLRALVAWIGGAL